MAVSTLQKSVKWAMGTPEIPGVRRRVYYISKSKIVKWPTLPKDASTNRFTSVVLTGAFQLAADAKWLCLDVDPNKAQLTSDPQGEAPSQTQLNKLSLVHPSSSAEASALSAYLNNDDIVYLVEDMKGNFRVVGSEDFITKSTVAQDGGQGPTGTVTTTVSVEATDVCIAPFYKGAIVAEDGTFNGTTAG